MNPNFDFQFAMCLVLAAIVAFLCRAFYIIGYQAATDDQMEARVEQGFTEDAELMQRLETRINNAINQTNGN